MSLLLSLPIFNLIVEVAKLFSLNLVFYDEEEMKISVESLILENHIYTLLLLELFDCLVYDSYCKCTNGIFRDGIKIWEYFQTCSSSDINSHTLHSSVSQISSNNIFSRWIETAKWCKVCQSPVLRFHLNRFIVTCVANVDKEYPLTSFVSIISRGASALAICSMIASNGALSGHLNTAVNKFVSLFWMSRLTREGGGPARERNINTCITYIR